MTPQRPRPISTTDDTTRFTCGEASLDRYLTDRALPNHLAGFSRCYVSIDDETERVVGYYTLSAVAIARESLDGRSRRNAPDPVPAVLLGRLAVDRTTRGSGLGRLLVRDAILSTLAASDRIGVRILLVHALDDQATAFYTNPGFRSSPTDPLHLYLLLNDAKASIEADTRSR